MGEGSLSTNPNSASALTAIELEAYFLRKRQMIVWSLLLAALTSLAIVTVSPLAALATFFGTLCGIANALLVMRGNERLVDHRSVGLFVFSSVLRIAVFGIVPVEFSLAGPWWTMGLYFAGFFMPLALYWIVVGRSIRMGSTF